MNNNIQISSKSFDKSAALANIDSVLPYLQKQSENEAMINALYGILGSQDNVNFMPLGGITNDIGGSRNIQNSVIPSTPSSPSGLQQNLPIQQPNVSEVVQPSIEEISQQIKADEAQLKAQKEQVNLEKVRQQATQQQAQSTQTQAQATQAPQPKREVSLMELLGQGLNQAFKPTSSTGETNTIYDMLRGVAAVNAPQVSNIWEQDLKDLKEKEKERIKMEQQVNIETFKALQKQLENEADFKEKIFMEKFKNELEQKGVNEKVIKRLDAFGNNLPKDKQIQGYGETLKEVGNIRANLESGSEFGYQSLINQLIRLSGDNRINEYDRKAFIQSLNVVDAVKVKLQKALQGGALSEKDVNGMVKDFAKGKGMAKVKEEALKIVEYLEQNAQDKVKGIVDSEVKYLYSTDMPADMVDSFKERMYGRLGVISQATTQQKKQGGILMVDANGNKAMVYPDGTIEEIK